MLPSPLQSSLPAGWLAFTGRESNPPDHYKRFQIVSLVPFSGFILAQGKFQVALPTASECANLSKLTSRDRRSTDEYLAIWCPAAACAGCRDGSRGVSCRDEWLEASRRPRPPCAARPWPGADDPDWDRRCRGRPGEDLGSRGAQRWRANSLHLGDPAAVGTAHEELGRTFAGALPAGHLDGRLPGGAGGTLGQGCAESFSGSDLQTDGGVAGRVRALAEARSCRRAGTCTCGRTASSCRLAWKTMANACWC